MASPTIALHITSDAAAAQAGIQESVTALDKLDTSARNASGNVDAAATAVKTYGTNASDAAGKSKGVSDNIGAIGDTAGRATTGLRDMADAVALAGFPELAAGMTLAATGLEAVDGAANLYRATSDTLAGSIGKLTGANKGATDGLNRTTTATNKGRTASMLHRIATLAQRGATVIMTTAQRILNTVMRANPIGIVVTVIMLLVGALIAAYKKSETFRKIVDKLWQILKNSLVTAFEAVSGAVETVVGWFKSAWEWVKKLIDSIKNLKLPDWLPGVGGNITVGPTVQMAGTGPAARAPAAGVVVNFNGPVGDPHAIARELRKVLRDDQARLGRRDRTA